MYCILKHGGHNRGHLYHFADSGLSAVRERERMGLPESTSGSVWVYLDPITDRRAAEAWPEALDGNADLPGFGPDEFKALIASGLVVFAGPEKDGSDVALRAKLACSPFELVCWRRAWAAERRAQAAEAKLAELQSSEEQQENDDE